METSAAGRWQGGPLGAAAGWGRWGSAGPSDPYQLCWCRRPAPPDARSHPGCAPQVLLEEEPSEHLRTDVRQEAMLALGDLRYLSSPWSGPGPGFEASPV